MEVLEINQRRFKRMPKVSLVRSVPSTECELFIFEEKENWVRRKKLLKKYFLTSSEYFSNKLYTINTLIDNRKILDIDEIVLPEKLFSLDKKIEGFVMPFIERNVNLQVYLNSAFLSLEKKIEILKKIGLLLEKLLRLNNPHFKFFLGDIHEGNFIYDVDKKMFRAVDLDSCKIGNNNPSISRYLTFNPNLWDFPRKYPLNEDDIHISNENTTILSYIYMVLNSIAQTPVHKLSIDEYYDYMQYLLYNGVSRDLIYMFELIYTKGQNELDINLLDGIPKEKGPILTYSSFKKRI